MCVIFYIYISNSHKYKEYLNKKGKVREITSTSSSIMFSVHLKISGWLILSARVMYWEVNECMWGGREGERGGEDGDKHTLT